MCYTTLLTLVIGQVSDIPVMEKFTEHIKRRCACAAIPGEESAFCMYMFVLPRSAPIRYDLQHLSNELSLSPSD